MQKTTYASSTNLPRQHWYTGNSWSRITSVLDVESSEIFFSTSVLGPKLQCNMCSKISHIASICRSSINISKMHSVERDHVLKLHHISHCVSSRQEAQLVLLPMKRQPSHDVIARWSSRQAGPLVPLPINSWQSYDVTGPHSKAVSFAALSRNKSSYAACAVIRLSPY